jgi:metallo-beta-lactamase class B
MSAADWDVVAKDNSPAEFKPRRDMVVTDGQQIKLGDVTVTLYITPGHTPGTLSMIIEPLTNKNSVASDNGRYVASIWGGADPSIGRQGVRY